MKLIIPFELPGLNEYIHEINKNRHAGNKMKQDAQESIGWIIKQQHIKPITGPVRVNFLWVTKNRKKDLDNVCFAKKFILDALVQFEVLTNDARKDVCGFTDNFEVDKDNPRIEIEIMEATI